MTDTTTPRAPTRRRSTRWIACSRARKRARGCASSAPPRRCRTRPRSRAPTPTASSGTARSAPRCAAFRGLSTELEDVTEVEYRQLRLENVVLVGVHPQGEQEDAENSLRELSALAETAGAVVLDGVLQRRPHPDPATYIGRGKAQELRDIVAAVGADTVIADTELAPSQRRALEDVVKVKVIDRTTVILDIFSQHAKSREGKAQVELAQLEYLLPRLRGWGDSMSRQAGGQVGAGGAGMGSRGPGETKIELDRRRIRTKMALLRRQIRDFAPARDAKRAERKRNTIPSVAIAGLHERRQVEPAQPADERGRARRERAVRDAGCHRPPLRDDRRPRLHAHRHGRVRPQPAAPARRGVPLDARRGRRRRRHRARRRRRAPRSRRRSCRRCAT